MNPHHLHERDEGRPGGRRYHHPRGRRGPLEDRTFGEGRRPGGRGRASRGDVRTAVLLLLAEQPMHGYQLMQAIAERTGGTWTPSPGAVYPTINMLEDEGLVSITADAGRKLVSITDTGREQLDENADTWGDPFSGREATGPAGDLRRLVHDLLEASRHLGRTGTEAQREQAARILADAKRALYLVLADSDEAGK